MATSASISPYPHHPPEIRLVLLGSVDEGKRSAGNTILGRDVFGSQKTAECVIQQGWMGQRQVTVINTPGWGREQRLSQTPQNVREQLLRSVFPPGVHALILVIRADRKFTEANRVALQDHMELLGDRVWDHTIVLFTCGDWLGDTPIENFIHSEGRPLQWVVEKSSYKYYCIDNKNRADISQVSRLLELIEMMVAGNKGHFELEKQIYVKVFEGMLAQVNAVQEMKRKAEEMRQRWVAQPPRCDSRSEPPLMSGEPTDKNFKSEPTCMTSIEHHKEAT
ncbi:GTPase IMAP family member 9-like [Sardina pilchardus]|uniref:GTPase IMAP family member 9-like n=1 Tax=Sardina pilchardus TaxID=27697 RepID=UPI002E134271